VDLDVFYQHADSIDNPWPEAELASHEHLLPGRRVSYGTKRTYINWHLPDFEAYDLVVLNTSYVSPTVQWLMRAQLSDTPWVFWGERIRKQSTWWRRLGKQLLTAPLRQADAIVGIGSLAVQSYQRAFPERPVYNIPYFTDLTSFRDARQSGKTDVPLTLLFCGQMIERKGLDLLLQAFDQLVAEDLPVRLRLVGREANVSEMMTTVRPEAQERIEILGFQAPEDLPELFGTADVFVLPSRHDGWGVVVNQALGAGLPIICSDQVGAAHDLVESEKNGVRVQAGNVRPLLDALRRVASDASLRQKWADGSRSMAKHWSVEDGADRWVQVAHDLVEKVPHLGQSRTSLATNA
jgi:glycosyltransferase involved in cell wall biosynthesis